MLLRNSPLHMTVNAAAAALLSRVLQASSMYDSLVKSINRGYMAPWGPHEDLLLLRAVRSHGTNWKAIEALGVVQSRSARQMRERFAKTLDPAIDHSPLNAEVRQPGESVQGFPFITWAFELHSLLGCMVIRQMQCSLH
jgi:hypothetical protein